MVLLIKQPSLLPFKKKIFIEYFLPSELYRNSEATFAFLNMLTLQEGNKILCSLIIALYFLCAAYTSE